MNSKSWFAKMVDRDLGSFPGRIEEVISAFKAFKKAGWGKGLSGRHFKKLINRDESIFTTTWAELRREYFQEIILKINPYFGYVKVPLPCYPDGKVLSDKDIRDKVKTGHRLMFCPIIDAKEFNGSSLISLGELSHLVDIVSQQYEKKWLAEIDRNSRKIGKPYWFWIDCSKDGTSFYSRDKFPTLIEYLITAYVTKEETSKLLDENNFIWLKHCCPDDTRVLVGANPPKKIYGSKIVDLGRAYEYKPYQDADLIRHPMMTRFTEII